MDFSVTTKADAAFFIRDVPPKPAPPWLGAMQDRAADLMALAALLAVIFAALLFAMNRLAGSRYFTPARLLVLAVVVGFVGWWGQGQLSIATVLGVIRAGIDRQSLEFLLYDPFSLLIWVVVLISFVIWGRGLFCGWLCPFGAMQEFAHHIGRLLRLPQIEPSTQWDDRLKWIKYIVLGALVALLLTAPGRLDKAIEVEPFKTAITTFFIREWYYVAYAAFWLLSGETKTVATNPASKTYFRFFRRASHRALGSILGIRNRRPM